MKLNKLVRFNIYDMNCEYRTLRESDVTKEYLDSLIKKNEYIQNIPDNVSIATQQQYIREILLSNRNTINGLFINNKLVGTAGIQSSVQFLANVDLPAEYIVAIGIFLFDMNYRGLGFGTTLVWASVYLFYNCTGEEWFSAGMKKENIPCLKSFLSCGFKQVYEDKEYYKVLINRSELTQPEFIKEKAICGID